MIVHILRHGRVACGFMHGTVPGEWPEGHRWVSFEAPGDVTCEQCCVVENVRSRLDREDMLRRMRVASQAFYYAATQIRCHPFIEFTGLMNEYIKMCGAAHVAGIDFPSCNTHSGKALPMKDYEANYLGEKLDCIYGPSLAEPGNRAAFLEGLLGKTRP